MGSTTPSSRRQEFVLQRTYSTLPLARPVGFRQARSFGILSTFPPTPCGIATFSAALASGLLANGCSVDVVRCGATPTLEDSSVVATLGRGTPAEFRKAVAALNRTDVAVIQHEYGLFDGPDGDSLLNLMAAIEVPAIVVAHTVLQDPTRNQRDVLSRVCAEAEAVVVMTNSAHQRLLAGFDVDPDKVLVIPHGAATPLDTPPVDDHRESGRVPTILTWGLLGPGKGIEWAIDALAMLGDLRPQPSYVVAGATHPKVRAKAGEAYREMLIERAEAAGMTGHVRFDDAYRDLASLTELICSADLVVLPYDSVDQVTSGVLVDAVAAGRPVVSTAFPHAVELLGSGAGLVVPQRDPAALATAIRSVLTDGDLAASMAAEARRLAPDLSWVAVAGRYAELAARVIGAGSIGSRVGA